MDRDFLQAQIDATKLQIVALMDAELALAAGTIQSYTLDTGQNRQTAVKLNLTEVRKAIDSAYNRCAMLQARLTGQNTVLVSPSW